MLSGGGGTTAPLSNIAPWDTTLGIGNYDGRNLDPAEYANSSRHANKIAGTPGNEIYGCPLDDFPENDPDKDSRTYNMNCGPVKSYKSNDDDDGFSGISRCLKSVNLAQVEDSKTIVFAEGGQFKGTMTVGNNWGVVRYALIKDDINHDTKYRYVNLHGTNKRSFAFVDGSASIMNLYRTWTDQEGYGLWTRFSGD